MKRIFTLIHYIVYVIAISLVYGLIKNAIMSFDGVKKFEIDQIINLAILILPFVVCQIIFAIFVVRNLSLKRLFFLSVLFIFVLCILSVVIFPLLVKLGPTHILSFHWNLLELFFMFGIPLLILTIAQKRQTIAISQPIIKKTQVAGSNKIDIGSPQSQHSENKSSHKSYWWHWDIALVAVPLWFLVFLDPFGIINYMCGLINVPIHLFALFCSLLLLPAGLVCLIWFFVRMCVIWPRRIRPWSRLLLIWTVVIGGGAFYIGPFFIHILPRPFERYAQGFRRYVQTTTDIEAVQNWLGTLDPNNCENLWLDMNISPDVKKEYSSRIIPAPNVVVRLRPKISRLELDDLGRPMLRLIWGSGMSGSWGLVVGDKNMETPETELPRWEEFHVGKVKQKLHRHGETRLPVASGAYVWYELE